MSKHTPGPWYWSNSGGKEPTLFARPSLVVMDFVRMGMHGAQPRFSDRDGEPVGGLMHKWGDKDFNAHPDAVLIARAPEMAEEIERLRAENERLNEIWQTWNHTRNAVLRAEAQRDALLEAAKKAQNTLAATVDYSDAFQREAITRLRAAIEECEK